jgi:hypothetical protein
VEQYIISTLLFDPDLSALVADRIYDRHLPTNAVLPAIVYQRITTSRDYAHDKSSVTMPYWQFACWAESAGEADLVADALESAIDNLSLEPNRALFLENRIARHEASSGLYSTVVDVSALSSKRR